MARRQPQLRVDYTDQALIELGEIWDWNASQYGRGRATSYALFLEQNITG